MEALLLFVVGDAGAALSKPLAGRGVEDGGDGSFAAAGFALEALFELGGDAPTVDFGLHALQCSARAEWRQRLRSRYGRVRVRVVSGKRTSNRSRIEAMRRLFPIGVLL